ncbi:MAG: TldD/PmbA family protein [Acaryochloris sp. RU_4_1]|nr:TldD/PmbA family protein [Acaryochloris sp. SU_5_25]NJM68392.1 TldD/PmbA family protein [Acaryochloris sp. RU_4_1]NJN37659.1 TldD/PmbA family protein [Acaryochloridaceae cyanobacterium CSU_3_4]NJR54020.1 TldD/PmbA family protein [Acaryochloris sp. CRU_2_0]
MKFDLHQALNQLTLNADWVGLRQVNETTTTHAVRDGRPESSGRSFSQGVMVEVLAQGQFGYAATNRFDQASLQWAAEQAQQQAIATAKWAVHPFTADVRPKAVGQYQSPFQQPFDLISIADQLDLLVKVCETLHVSDQIVKTSAFAQTLETEQIFVSSNGSDTYQKLGLVITDYEATAQAGNVIQKRTDNGPLARCYQAGAEVFDPEQVLARVQRVGEQAIKLLTAADCPTTTTTLVLAPDQMMLQIHESVGHPLELDRILGDERNYAGSSFVKLADFGQLVYGSPLMNITFDPTVAGEFAGYAFDDAGMPAQREYLIKDGLLLRGLGSLESQARAKVPGVANCRARSWNRAPIDRMANLNLEPGSSSFAEMISRIESGVYMEANRSWSIDDYRNKFQFGCEYARLIENGQLTQVLRNPNYRGITNQFWRNLVQVGDRSTLEMYGTPYCGKGEPNQCIRVGHASPTCVFNQIEVFGGAA